MDWSRHALALVPVLIGASALLGWALHLPILTRIMPGFTTMKANTALGMIAAGVGLWSMPKKRFRWFGVVAGAGVAVLGLLTLGEYAFGVSLGIDDLLIADPNTTSPPYPGRMAPATAAAFLAVGGAILLLVKVGQLHPERDAWRVLSAHLLALVPACVGYLSIAGYTYRVDGLYSFGRFASVAINTSVGFVLLALSILSTMPARGWRRRLEGRVLARRAFSTLLPVALVVPFGSGAAVVFGAREHVYDSLYGPALFALVASGSAIWIVWHAATVVCRAEDALRSASAALRASEERLQLFVARAPAAIAMFDTEMRYLAVSQRYVRDYRLNVDGRADLIGRSHYEACPEISDRWRDNLRLVLAGQTLSAEDDQLPRDDGLVDWVRWEMTPWYHASGAIGGALLFSEVMNARKFDVTARKEAEAACRASEARLKAILDNMPLAVVLVEFPSGRVTFANSGVERVFRRPMTGSKLVGDYDTWESYHADGRPVEADEHPLARALATGELAYGEYHHVCGDGVRRWVSITGSPIRNESGAMTSVVAVCIDIDEKRGAEAALAESEARFRAITDAMPQMVWSTRPDGYCDYFNRRWYAMTGTTPEQAEGDRWSEMLHPDDRERILATWRDCLSSGDPYDVEYRLRMADGSFRWKLGRALPMRGPDGSIVRWFGTSTDIAQTVAARETLAQSRQDLERLVAERTLDLRETQERLAHVQRMEALGQLAGGIAHDFNNILQSVQSGASLLERRAADPDDVRRLSRMVFDAAGRGNAITKRLLVFSRRGDLRAEPVDAGALLADMSDIFSHTLGTGIVVQSDVETGLPNLLADKGQLETVLVNLATNARDAMTSGGTIRLSAATEAFHDGAPSNPATLQAGSYIRLSIADTGIGMDADTLAKASEPFFTTKPTGKGTGLGLAMARGFAEQSGGGLHIRSAPGEGTTVDLWFPMTPLTQALDGPGCGGVVGTSSTHRARLLLVDDEAFVRELVSEEMEAAGYSVVTADSAEAALALLDSGEQVELLISDLSMPGMDGVTLVGEAQRRRPGLPAILLTGFATNATEVAVGGATSGKFSLLRKPVEARYLTERVSMLLTAGEEGGKAVLF